MHHSTKRKLKRWAPMALVAVGVLFVVAALGVYAAKRLTPKSHHGNGERVAARVAARKQTQRLAQAYAAYHRNGAGTTTTTTTTLAPPPSSPQIAVVPGPALSCSKVQKPKPAACKGKGKGGTTSRHAARQTTPSG